MNRQPIYSIKINCVDCNFILFINDIKLLDFRTGANINTELPINALLQNGINHVSCDIYPTNGVDALPDIALVKLIVTETENSIGSRVKVTNIFSTPSFAHGESAGPVVEYSLKGEFSATILYPSLLGKGLIILNTEKTQRDLFEKYINLFNLFKNKDLNGIMKLYELRNREVASLKGIDLNELEKELRLDYETYFNDTGLKMWEFSYDKVFFKIYNYKKLACLEIKNGNQPLCFINREDHYAIYLPIYFFRNPATNDFEIIR